MPLSSWLHQRLTGRPQTQRVRQVRRSVRLHLEVLEGRLLPSLTPHLLKDIYPGARSSFVGAGPNFTAVGATVYFAANDGVHGFELWKSNGTAAGTVLVKDINPGSKGSYPASLTNVNGSLFFQANDGHGDALWKSNGTAAGTVVVKDIPSGVNSLTNVNGTLFFIANDDPGLEVWKSNGTAAGTVLVKDINPRFGSAPDQLTNINGTLFFQATDGHGYELWKSNGTAAGTVLVKDINPGSGSPDLYHLTNVNGTLFFVGNDGVHGKELWKSNGAAAGTVLVKDIKPGSGSGLTYTLELMNVNGTVFFQANDGVHGYELWKSNGAAAGTVLVKDIWPGSGSSDPYHLTNVNGTLFFEANDGVHGKELWKSNGAAAGTVLVKDIYPKSSTNGFGNGSYPTSLTNVNGSLFFAAYDGVHGVELWKSNGAAAGTVLVADINPGSKGSYPAGLTNVNGTLFFSANDGVHGVEPWILGPVPAPASATPAASGIQTPESAPGGAFATSLVTRGSQPAVALLAVSYVRIEAGAVRVAAAELDGGSRKLADTVAAGAHLRRHNNAAIDELLTLPGWEVDRRM